MASNEHDDQEVLVQSLCAFLLGLCIVYNNDSNVNFSKVLEFLLLLLENMRKLKTYL